MKKDKNKYIQNLQDIFLQENLPNNRNLPFNYVHDKIKKHDKTEYENDHKNYLKLKAEHNEYFGDKTYNDFCEQDTICTSDLLKKCVGAYRTQFDSSDNDDDTISDDDIDNRETPTPKEVVRDDKLKCKEKQVPNFATNICDYCADVIEDGFSIKCDNNNALKIGNCKKIQEYENKSRTYDVEMKK